MCRSRHRWSDRSQMISKPLFPGYVFCRLDPMYRLPLLTIPGVINLVAVGKTPVPIDDSEIAAIRSVMHSQLDTEPYPFPEGGKRVRLGAGPLAGLEGFLIDDNAQQQVVICVSALRRSVAVSIERAWIQPVGAPHSEPGEKLTNHERPHQI